VKPTCPTCHAPQRSLLSGCTEPACVAAEIAADATQDQQIEASEQ
jgi:hypothetical protein